MSYKKDLLKKKQEKALKILEFYRKIIRKTGRFPTWVELEEKFTIGEIRNTYTNLENLKNAYRLRYKAEYKKINPVSLQEKQVELANKKTVKHYYERAKKLKHLPRSTDLDSNIIKGNSFNNLEDIKQAFEKEYPSEKGKFPEYFEFVKQGTKQTIIDAYRRKSKELKRWPSISELGVDERSLYRHFGSMSGLRDAFQKEHPADFGNIKEFIRKAVEEAEDEKNAIVEQYINLCLLHSHHPSEKEFHRESSVLKNDVKFYFHSFKKLKEYALENHAEVLENVFDDDYFLNEENRKEVIRRVQTTERQLWSSIGRGSLDSNALRSALHYCEKNNARIFLNLTLLEFREIDSEIKLAHKNGLLDIVIDEVQINKNLLVSNIGVDEKVVDPAQGIKRRKIDSSVIYASPKQIVGVFPSKTKKFPRLQMSPGAITKPAYFKDELRKRKREVMAENDHMIGFIIVELEGDLFFARQTQILEDGKFVDWGMAYSPDMETVEVVDMRFVMGDLHSINKSQKTFDLWNNLMDSLSNISGVYIHDIMDASAVNPHEMNNPISKMVKVLEGQISLTNELKVLNQDIERAKGRHKQRPVYIIDSNHDDMLARSFANGSIWADGQNALFGAFVQPMAVFHQLRLDYTPSELKKIISERVGVDVNALEKFFGFVLEDRTLLQFCCEFTGLDSNNVHFLRKESSEMYGGFQMALHGHQGISGAKGSQTSFIRVIDKMIYGHTHKDAQNNFIMSVGNSAGDLRYARGGFSDWTKSGIFVYSTGQAQHVRSIKGRVRSFKNAYIHPELIKGMRSFISEQSIPLERILMEVA